MGIRHIRFSLLTIVILVGSATACRQPDGPIPKPTDEEQNKIQDVSRDLLAVSSRAPSAVQELSDDLANLAPNNQTAKHGAEMSRRLAASLEGVKLNEDAARQIARDLHIAFSARELSRSQVATLRDNLGSVLAKTGVQPASAEPVLKQVEQVQADVTTVKRRWWQFF